MLNADNMADYPPFVEIIRHRLIPDFNTDTPIPSLAIIAPALWGKTIAVNQIAMAAREAGWHVEAFDRRRRDIA